MKIVLVMLKNWKTTGAGVVASGLMLVSAAYKPGMSWHDWAAAIATLALGALAHDGF